jgi:hypothetical protein
MDRRSVLRAGVALALMVGTSAVRAAGPEAREEVAHKVLATWYRLALELIRHTPTMTPPVSSRALAYLGIGCFEALASGDAGLRSLAGRLPRLSSLPVRSDEPHDTAVLLHAVLSPMVHDLFSNTGPTGQHAMQTLEKRLASQAEEGITEPALSASRNHGAALAQAILDWSRGDGGAVIDNMGFPRQWRQDPEPGHWVPTSKIVLQQAPLLPDWGKSRPFALDSVDSVTIAEPTTYSEKEGSQFWIEAREVLETTRALTPEQIQIARFWSDDAMMSFTPPGHWTAILNQVAVEKGLDLTSHVEALARMGIAQADAFIACWAAKYRFDTLRPVSYIQKLMDPGWQPILITPPFPEYPSGHSVQSAAGAAVLTHLFGESYDFLDESPTPDGVEPRHFASFRAAAEEAAISRLYGGIHFRPAIANGQDLGRRVAAFAIALETRA